MIKFFLAGVLFSLNAVAIDGAWTSYVDCRDGHGNQLVVDIDVLNNSRFQLVVRPAVTGDSTIEFLTRNGFNEGVNEKGELLLKIDRAHLVDYATVTSSGVAYKVKLDNPSPSKMQPRTGARLSVSQGDRSLSWYFNTCQKRY